MMTIGVRELRQNPASAIGEAKRGRMVLVTEYGKPVARLMPLPEPESLGPTARLIAEGRMRPPVADPSMLPAPLPADQSRAELSVVLTQMRNDER